MIKNCLSCNQQINPKRLEILPNTKYCVDCSDSAPKKALTFQYGDGDHSYTDIVIVEESEYRTLMNKSSKFEKPKVLDENNFENEDAQAERLSKINPDKLDGDLE